MSNCKSCAHSTKLTMGKNAGTLLCLSDHKYSPKTLEGEHDCEAYSESVSVQPKAIKTNEPE